MGMGGVVYLGAVRHGVVGHYSYQHLEGVQSPHHNGSQEMEQEHWIIMEIHCLLIRLLQCPKEV